MSHKISYAQNREDVILEAFFDDVKNGFYVDVGANHPYYHSVTKIFYDKGWSGINFEPNPKLHSQLVEHRSKDKNILKGIAEKKGKLKLRIYHSPDGLEGISTFSDKMISDYEVASSEDTERYDDVEVEVSTLKDMFEKIKPKHIHFMKIDVEGYEYEVIKGNDWAKFRPEMICIEANHIINDWRPYLKNAGYSCVHNDGLNDYYLSDESAWRASKFDYSKVFLGNKPVVSVDIHNNLMSEKDKITNLEAKVESLKGERTLLTLENTELAAVIESITPLRRHVKRQLKQHIGAYAKKGKK